MTKTLKISWWSFFIFLENAVIEREFGPKKHASFFSQIFVVVGTPPTMIGFPLLRFVRAILAAVLDNRHAFLLLFSVLMLRYVLRDAF